jgi:hypothetical protein
MMRSLNPFAHTHPALTDLRNQDVAVYLISPLMAPAGGSNRVRVLIERKLFVLCNARNAQNAKRSRFGYAVVTRTRCWLSHQVPKMFFGKFVCMR